MRRRFAHAEATAQAIAGNAPLSVAAAKRAMRDILAGQPESQAMRAMAEACLTAPTTKKGAWPLPKNARRCFRALARGVKPYSSTVSNSAGRLISRISQSSE